VEGEDGGGRGRGARGEAEEQRRVSPGRKRQGEQTIDRGRVEIGRRTHAPLQAAIVAGQALPAHPWTSSSSPQPPSWHPPCAWRGRPRLCWTSAHSASGGQVETRVAGRRSSASRRPFVGLLQLVQHCGACTCSQLIYLTETPDEHASTTCRGADQSKSVTRPSVCTNSSWRFPLYVHMYCT
jgi:hypothetical protein